MRVLRYLGVIFLTLVLFAGGIFLQYFLQTTDIFAPKKTDISVQIDEKFTPDPEHFSKEKIYDDILLFAKKSAKIYSENLNKICSVTRVLMRNYEASASDSGSAAKPEIHAQIDLICR